MVDGERDMRRAVECGEEGRMVGDVEQHLRYVGRLNKIKEHEGK